MNRSDPYWFSQGSGAAFVSLRMGYGLVNVYIDVKNPWFPEKNDLQMVGFPHLCSSTGRIRKVPVLVEMIWSKLKNL